MKTDLLLKIYLKVKTKPKPKYQPIRKYYNVATFV